MLSGGMIVESTLIFSHDANAYCIYDMADYCTYSAWRLCLVCFKASGDKIDLVIYGKIIDREWYATLCYYAGAKPVRSEGPTHVMTTFVREPLGR